MTRTRKRFLLTLCLLGIAIGITVFRAYLSLVGAILPMRATGPVAAAAMCAALWGWTVNLRRRLPHVARAKHEREHPGQPFVMQVRPVHPIVAARSVALAFAASRAGGLIDGVYAGIAVKYLAYWDSADVRLRFVWALLTTLLAGLLIVIALWLERSCRLPDPPATANPAPQGT